METYNIIVCTLRPVISNLCLCVDYLQYQRKRYKALHVTRDAKLRFMLDDFVTPSQCKTLLEVVRNYSVPGDGYQGTTTPHTIHEDYGGLSLGRAGKLVSTKQMDKRSLTLILDVADDIKRTIIQRFAVEKKLHFTFTHLVFRTAKSGAQNNRSDLSHAVHADNCNVQLDGSCPRKSPAFVWRDYTAILYLNNEFLGGELFFSKDYYGNDVEEIVVPKCGRLVGFTSGGENLHGVKAVKDGSRYALAVWFTYDKTNFEPERKVLSKYHTN